VAYKRFSSTMDSGKYNALSLEECVDGDSIVDISSEIHEVALQQDCDQSHMTLDRTTESQ
jgi:hypothetical protein